MTPEFTFWYLPTSDSYHKISLEDFPPPMSIEITESAYVKGIIEQIDNDPEHKLPKGIAGVIKLAYVGPADTITGFLWYDKFSRFPNNYPISLFDPIKKDPGGVYHTKFNAYLVEMIDPEVIKEEGLKNG